MPADAPRFVPGLRRPLAGSFQILFTSASVAVWGSATIEMRPILVLGRRDVDGAAKPL